MTERDMLLRSILTEPDEDTHRLVFADWCDENGEPQWAALIRQQVNDLRKPQVHRPGQAAEYVWHLTPTPLVLAPAVPGWQYTTDRGFVSEIHLPCAVFLEHAQAIFAAHPVTRVRLSDAQNTGAIRGTDDGHIASFRISSSVLLYPLLKSDDWATHGYGGHPDWRSWKTLARAEKAWSDACVAYGRAAAGLPPLPTRTAGAA